MVTDRLRLGEEARALKAGQARLAVECDALAAEVSHQRGLLEVRRRAPLAVGGVATWAEWGWSRG